LQDVRQSLIKAIAERMHSGEETEQQRTSKNIQQQFDQASCEVDVYQREI